MSPVPASPDRAEEILEVWRVNQRINLRLLAAIGAAGMRCTLSARGGRSVARQFGHLHYVRVYQLKHRAKALAAGLRVFATAEEPDRRALVAALEASSARVEEWFRRAAAGDPSVRVFKRGLVAMVCYLVSHEAHHRGNILLTLKQCGHAVDSAVRYGIWDWDRV